MEQAGGGRTGVGQAGAHEAPTRIGPYLVERRLGAGGMGVVYLASSPTGRTVALKVVRGQHAEDPDFRRRFAHEVTAARAVSGAFTASVVDADPDGDPPWLATQFIDAPTLAELVSESGPLPLDRVRSLGYGLAEALRDIHRAGVVHRDLKPANVMIAEDGPRVIDFGISRPHDSTHVLTTTGKLLGTPPFMSPEQLVRPAEVGPASDVFALGALLVFAACGHGPFDADTPYVVAYQVVQGEPDLTGLPEQLTGLVSLCLAKEPADRPTPERLMELLGGDTGELAGLTVLRPRAAARDDEPTAPTTPQPAPTPPPRRRRRVLWAAAAALALLAGGATTMALRPSPAKPRHVAAPAPTPTGPAVEATAAARPAGWQSWASRLPGAPKLGGFRQTSVACAAFGGDVDCLDLTNNTLYRLDPATGRTLWHRALPQQVEGWGTDRAAGLFLVVDDEESPTGIRNQMVHGVDALTGAVRWHFVVPPITPDILSVVGPGSASQVLVANAEQGWYALDPRNGRLLNPDSRSATAPAPGAAAEVPMMAVDQLVLTSRYQADGTTVLRAVGLPGRQVRWSLPLPDHELPFLLPQSGAGEGSGEGSVGGSAAASVDVLIGPVAAGAIGVQGDVEARELVHVDLATGRKRVTTLAQPLAGKAVVAGPLVVAQRADGYVVAADELTGRVVWQGTFPAAIGGGPVYADGRVYLPVSGGRIVCVDAATGKELWISAQRMDPSVPLAAASLAVVPTAAGLVGATADLSLFGLVPPPH